MHRALLQFALLAATQLAWAQTPAPIVTEPQLFEALGADFAPTYADLKRNAQALQSAVVQLCGARSSAAALRDARTAWLRTARDWRVLEAWPIGPMIERRSLRRFDFWPTRVPQIEVAAAQFAGGAPSLDTIGFSAQGLPALEYLLFDSTQGAAPAARSAGHCMYAGHLAESFAVEAGALAAAWSDWTSSRSRPEAQPALGEALNVLIGGLERLRTRKLAKPAAAPAGAAPTWDAWRSGATHEHLQASLRGAERVLRGGESRMGLLALLRGQGYLALAARLDRETKRAADAVRALPAGLGSRRAAEGAARAVGRLQSTLSGDVAEVLRVAVGFNETDGD